MKSFILRDRNLTILPPNLPKHVGFFDCSENNLTSLDGAPVTVDDDFDAVIINYLLSLDHHPKLNHHIFATKII